MAELSEYCGTMTVLFEIHPQMKHDTVVDVCNVRMKGWCLLGGNPSFEGILSPVEQIVGGD